jgi:hypothetical protein
MRKKEDSEMEKVDLMASDFNNHKFWDEMERIKGDYSIRVAKKPHKRSAKRITILVSTAYIESGGWIHWVQALEAEVYRAVKDKHLDCDPLEMEHEDRSYTCRNKKSKLFGKKIRAARFENHMICEVADDVPKAALFAGILTDYLALEKEDKDAAELSGDHPRARTGTTFGREKRHPVPPQEAGIALRTAYKKSQGVSGK